MGSVRHALALAFAVLAWLSAAYLWQLQNTLGPRHHHINVRFATDVSADARGVFEQQRGLVAGEDQGTRTWKYLLTDQSAGNIRALLQSPLVEDTAHIDRQNLRIELDLPNVRPWLVELLARQWLPYGSWFLIAIGAALAWSARRTAAGWARVAAREAPRGLEAMAGRVETLATRHEILVALVMGLLFLVPMLWHGPTDDEELALGTFSSQIYYRDLLHGRWAYWLTNLGFGTPMPLGHRLDFHPVFALGSLISLRVALSAVWIIHVGVMSVYFLRLLAPYGLTPVARLVFLGLYVFSLPSFLLFFTTDWVSCQVPWTLYPVLVYYLREAAMGGAASRWWLTTIRLGLLFSLWALNGHPGYLVPLFIVLAAYTLAVARPSVAMYSALGVAGVFALAASSERIYFLVHEMRLFPADILRLTQDGYSLQTYPTTYLATQAWPFVEVPNDERRPFVGAFVFGAALAAPVLWRTADRHVRACIIAFFVALAMSMVPNTSIQWSGLSGVWLFRDALVFFGLLSAAAVAQSALRASNQTIQRLALGLLALQAVQQVIVIAPGYWAQWDGNPRLEWYRHQEHPMGVAAAVVRASSRYGNRLYLSPRATELSRGYMSEAGVHVMTDYALLGLNPVNIWFKNVSMDQIHPSWRLMHGLIRGQRSVIENPTLLDVLGINVVVAMTDEGLSPTALTRIDHVRVNAEAGVEIFANPDAWPKAVLLSLDARRAELPIVAGCEHTAALCRDYTAFARARLPQEVSLRENEDGYRVHVPPSDAPRLLFLSAFYRPEWVATSGDQTLAIEPIAGAFIGVTVPAGVQDVELEYRPHTRIALTWVSGTSLVVMLAALGAIHWRRRATTAGGRRFRAGRKSRESAACAPAPS